MDERSLTSTERTQDIRLVQQVHQQPTNITDEHINSEAPGDLDVLPRRGRREEAFGDLPEFIARDAFAAFFVEWEADGVVPELEAMTLQTPLEDLLPLLPRAGRTGQDRIGLRYNPCSSSTISTGIR